MPSGPRLWLGTRRGGPAVVLAIAGAGSARAPSGPCSTSRPYFNYILVSESTQRTYNGITNDLERRLRQHRGEAPGGAKSTRTAKDWSYLAVAGHPDWGTAAAAASFEVRLRYPTGSRPRPARFSGPEGRLRGLALVLQAAALQAAAEERAPAVTKATASAAAAATPAAVSSFPAVGPSAAKAEATGPCMPDTSSELLEEGGCAAAGASVAPAAARTRRRSSVAASASSHASPTAAAAAAATVAEPVQAQPSGLTSGHVQLHRAGAGEGLGNGAACSGSTRPEPAWSAWLWVHPLYRDCSAVSGCAEMQAAMAVTEALRRRGPVVGPGDEPGGRGGRASRRGSGKHGMAQEMGSGAVRDREVAVAVAAVGTLDKLASPFTTPFSYGAKWEVARWVLLHVTAVKTGTFKVGSTTVTVPASHVLGNGVFVAIHLGMGGLACDGTQQLPGSYQLTGGGPLVS
ncbi:hypothetical protein HYH02_015055 [Chlamydomonas schloesseri]|uniref:GIY-YIG domain-containing protein n=1 Tax=Chlamydomonas schloesseri TaxID=2026947 RepID=A0A835SDE0_9CHLO|nr:hypothetical protein HYH02_015055 [Chlamydomonas schloesseri]|eukprot:KAG2425228.1 hypothetical protein HYH02_015055 [Chlamydomonas schloesseri]